MSFGHTLTLDELYSDEATLINQVMSVISKIRFQRVRYRREGRSISYKEEPFKTLARKHHKFSKELEHVRHRIEHQQKH